MLPSNSGQSRMQHSSHSQSHCSHQIPQVRRRGPKKKTIRRRRIDLNCGCSYYLHINCTNHGFTHRGYHHCSSGTEWRFYLADNKSPTFQDNRPHVQTLQQQPRHNITPNPIQPQPQEGIGDSQMFSQLQNLDEITDEDWSFLNSL
uniref:Transcriptional activator protein n=1 Tax=Deinbollia mosaic virus TaxID=1812308 RepID=A0A142C6L8_9GEMI|nr:transcription activator protein [Deinbollia mosaic virus]